MIFSVIWFVYSVNGDGLFGTCAVRSIENTTSAAVKSEPSWNLTPLRSLNSHVRSLIAFHETASAGFNRDFGSLVTSVSKICSAILLFGVRLWKCGSIEVTSAPIAMLRSAAVAAPMLNSSVMAAKKKRDGMGLPLRKPALSAYRKFTGLCRCGGQGRALRVRLSALN